MAKRTSKLIANDNFDNSKIIVQGARENNLKNIDIAIPKNKLVVFTGVSGSGKSSLAFDTIYNEGQRRYMESFGAYARQFLGNMERPDVDKISGLSPVISIEQKTTNKNPRSTVGTVTELYDFLRLLFARIGEAYSYNTGKKMVKLSEEEIIQTIFEKFKEEKILILAPLVRGRKGHYRELFEETRKKGFLKVRIDGEVKDLTPKLQVDRYKVHNIEIVVDRLEVTMNMKLRLSQSIQQSLKIGKDLIFVASANQISNNKDAVFSKQLMCVDTGISYEEPSPNTFSFNSPYGACPTCKGLGVEYNINIDAVLPNKSKTIKEGGIVPLGEERDASVFKQVVDFAKKNKISLDTPLEKLSDQQLNLILFGDKNITQDLVINMNDENIPNEYTGSYEGIIPMLKRWFTSTNSTDFLQGWVEKFMTQGICSSCNGKKLRKESLWIKINNKNISDISEMNLDKLMLWLNTIEHNLNSKQNIIAKDILKEIRERLQFLLDVGLSYLSLNRSSKSLSGGEAQRIRLATQIGSKLQGITYILDEPSIGLHQRDNHKLIDSLKNLRDIGNSILVVEHDKDIMLASDYLVDIGPKAGKHGGQIVAFGTPKEILK
ncbi:MAG TPA: excinuclease ABC subunit UvrA, partial [Chitinophagaceae bacterium]|nr:excinuclease ABC subunit UvrA [Chitinophagaceae bacterium]